MHTGVHPHTCMYRYIGFFFFPHSHEIHTSTSNSSLSPQGSFLPSPSCLCVPSFTVRTHSGTQQYQPIHLFVQFCISSNVLVLFPNCFSHFPAQKTKPPERVGDLFAVFPHNSEYTVKYGIYKFLKLVLSPSPAPSVWLWYSFEIRRLFFSFLFWVFPRLPTFTDWIFCATLLSFQRLKPYKAHPGKHHSLLCLLHPVSPIPWRWFPSLFSSLSFSCFILFIFYQNFLKLNFSWFTMLS